MLERAGIPNLCILILPTKSVIEDGLRNWDQLLASLDFIVVLYDTIVTVNTPNGTAIITL